MSTRESSYTLYYVAETIEAPTFERVALDCQQEVKHQIVASMESDQNIKLCHVDSAGLRFNCRHFINGHNVTSLVSKGQAAMSLTDASVRES
jgi:hypothetical protein